MIRASHIFCAILLFALAAAPCRAATGNPPLTPAPAAGGDDSQEKARAFALFDELKMVEAMPLLEKLAQNNPTDGLIWERYGVAMMSYSSTLPDPAQRKEATGKAREILLKAKALGDNSNLVKTLLNLIPPGGADAAFSASKQAEDAMEQAEADFARGDLDKALAGYQRALIFDPHLYEAALFSGDACYKQGDNLNACKWYDRAVHINPARETAYRYWGDSLMAEGKMDEARSKFIDAVIAEPYVDRPWTGLGQWAEQNNVKLTPLALKNHADAAVKGGDATIHFDPTATTPDSAVWLTYGLVRAEWETEKFKKAFPEETSYRHSLPEEADALHMMAGVLTGVAQKKGADAGDKPADPALEGLVKIDQAGLLEAYIFLERGDEGIAKDYPAYRAAHADQLRRYLDEFLVPKTPAK
jgi:tetratricopeptide (TPR) repeat protein